MNSSDAVDTHATISALYAALTFIAKRYFPNDIQDGMYYTVHNLNTITHNKIVFLFNSLFLKFVLNQNWKR